VIVTTLLVKLHPRFAMLYLYFTYGIGSFALIHGTEDCSILTYTVVINKI